MSKMLRKRNLIQKKIVQNTLARPSLSVPDVSALALEVASKVGGNTNPQLSKNLNSIDYLNEDALLEHPENSLIDNDLSDTESDISDVSTNNNIRKKRSYNFCFTIYEDAESMKKLYASKEEVFVEHDVRYIICGLETCPKTNRKHIQGYIEYNKQKTFDNVKVLFGNKTHIEIALGKASHNQVYCGKEDKSPYVYGKPKSQGKRNDLENQLRSIVSGELSTKDWFLTNPANATRYLKQIKEIKNSFQTERDFQTEIIIVIGQTDVGKSTFGQDENKGKRIYHKSTNPNVSSDWWDGYDGQEIVIWNEFDYRKFPIGYLLALADCKPYQVPNKGGHANFIAKKIYLTCNEDNGDITEWYKDATESQKLALFSKRVSEIIHMERLSKEDIKLNSADIIKSKQRKIIRNNDWSLVSDSKLKQLSINVDLPVIPELIEEKPDNILNECSVLVLKKTLIEDIKPFNKLSQRSKTVRRKQRVIIIPRS